MTNPPLLDNLLFALVGLISAFITGCVIGRRLKSRQRPTAAPAEHAANSAALETARLAEEKYRSIFENAIEGIFQTTTEGKYLSANPRLAKIYGYDSPAALMLSLQNIERQLYVEPLRRNEFTRLMDKFDEIRDFESQIYRRDGSTIWISENARAIRDRNGHLLYYEGTVEDITDRKQALGLQAEKEAAVAASEAKSVFLAHMSHEIRTPLNGVIGMLELLKQTPLSEQQERYTTIARSSAENLLATINDVLDFSKIEAGKLELETVPFKLNELIEEVAEMFSHRAYAQGIELSCCAADDVPDVVYGDPQRLRQVLINLIGNALKFTRQGTISIQAHLIECSAGNAVVRLSVRDTGIGIPSERRHRLFTPFSQVDSSTTRKFGGTGLGLAICRQIVELMRGRIDVESEADRGSTFWIEIPFAVPIETSVTKSPARPQLGGLRVLAIDDQPTSVGILRLLFGCWKMEVESWSEATDVGQRIQTLQRSQARYSLVVITHHPPTIDASAVAASIREIPELAALPVIVLTGVDAKLDQGEFKAARAAVLSKPLRQSRLYDTVATLMYRPKCEEATASQFTATDSQNAASDAGSNEKVVASPVPHLRVLVAEDNDINQLVTNEILRSAGHECVLVTTGEQAINALRRGGYDLVLMDCHMPELDGFDATRRIRRLEEKGELPHTRRGPIPIIALTANAIRGDRDRCLAAGMNDYATKPVDRAKLLALIARYGGQVAPASHDLTESDGDYHDESQETILDYDGLMARCSGDDGFARKLLARFQERLPGASQQVITALRTRDASARTLVHTLKGTAANLGANSLRAALQRLEADLNVACVSDQRVVTERLELEVAACLNRIDECLIELEELV